MVIGSHLITNGVLDPMALTIHSSQSMLRDMMKIWSFAPEMVA